jgi:hypothetical protein
MKKEQKMLKTSQLSLSEVIYYLLIYGEIGTWKFTLCEENELTAVEKSNAGGNLYL